MKNLILLLTCCTYFHLVQAQSSEFTVHQNGLIYDLTTMAQLSDIVDSLNLQFRSCDLDKTYFALPQGPAHYIEIPNKAALKLIKSGASFDAYQERYPQSIKNHLWVTQEQYTNYKGKRIIYFKGLPGTASPSIEISDHQPDPGQNSRWVFNDSEAFYLIEWKPIPIPESYARLIQYVDCMVDPEAEIYYPQAEFQVYQQVSPGSAAHKFVQWASRYPDRPDHDDYQDNWQAYQVNLSRWDSSRLAQLDEKMNRFSLKKELLIQARDEALENGNSSVELEFYIARYISKADALQLKRSRKVMGNCSMDDSPRVHAMEICMLSAETTQWDIFLRSHLNIMNDRFDRQSDGSYAWGARQTYLKELESLNIEAVDLLLGTCFRASNLSDNHYYGSIGRMGRALSETQDSDQLESLMLEIVQNPQVDLFNRTLFAYLFRNYNHYISDTTRQSKNATALLTSIDQLPKEVQDALRKW